VEDAGVPILGDRRTDLGAVVAGYTAPHSGRRASSPNRNDNRTKRRPAVTSKTSCRCKQLNSSAQQEDQQALLAAVQVRRDQVVTFEES
jgi:hypothetical protein